MKGQQLGRIKGLPPNLIDIPPGCPFNPRCPMAQAGLPGDGRRRCCELGAGRASACHFAEELREP